MMSPQIDQLAVALCQLQSELEDVERNSENPFFKSGYADLSAVWKAVRPLLCKNGLSITQVGNHADDGLETILMHKSGQWISGTVPFLLKERTMQSLGSAISYARRYGLSAILGVSQKDDDGNAPTQPEKKTPVNTTGVNTPSQTAAAQGLDKPGDHVITVGKKYAGMKIKHLSKEDWEGYSNYLMGDADKSGKPLSKNAQDFIDYGHAHFNNPNKPTDIAY